MEQNANVTASIDQMGERGISLGLLYQDVGVSQPRNVLPKATNVSSLPISALVTDIS